MNRQYIGARYVPIFADPIEWSNQRVYEPLTIVTYLGSSYTSRKLVPAGMLPTNNEYWANTGNYNAQVEEYRQKVVNLEALMNNAKIHGAKGDGVTDDTVIIKSLLTQFKNVYLPEGVYVVTDTIVLENTTLTLDNNAVIKAATNVPVIRIKQNGRISGGTIDASVTGHTSPIITLMGEDRIDGNDLVCVENTILIGTYNNDAIYMCANALPLVSGEESRSWIQFTTVRDVVIHQAKRGIYIKAEQTDNTLTATWVNANLFDNIMLDGCRQGIVTEGGGVPSECSGNSFKNIHLQWFKWYTTEGVILNGELHELELFSWDAPEDSKIIICNAHNCIIETNAYNYAKNIFDHGDNNHIFGQHVPSVSLPSAMINNDFGGEQDDCFYSIDKSQSVVVSTGVNPSPLFDGSDATGLSFTASTVVDITYTDYKPRLYLIGVAMKWRSSGGYVKIEVSEDGVTYNNIFERENLNTKLVYTNVANILVKAVRFTFSGCTVERIFGGCTNPSNTYTRYVSSYDGLVRGTLRLAYGAHIALSGEDGYAYLLKVVDGQLVAEKVT